MTDNKVIHNGMKRMNEKNGTNGTNSSQINDTVVTCKWCKEDYLKKQIAIHKGNCRKLGTCEVCGARVRHLPAHYKVCNKHLRSAYLRIANLCNIYSVDYIPSKLHEFLGTSRYAKRHIDSNGKSLPACTWSMFHMFRRWGTLGKNYILRWCISTEVDPRYKNMWVDLLKNIQLKNVINISGLWYTSDIIVVNHIINYIEEMTKEDTYFKKVIPMEKKDKVVLKDIEEILQKMEREKYQYL